jgi:adenylate cyclase
VLWLLGYPDRALRRSLDALALARELSHPSTMANVLFFAAWFHLHRGEWQTVQARVEEGLTLATEHGFSRWLAQATFLQGWLLAERGQKEAGIALMVEALATERAGMGLARWNALFAALLAEAYRKTEQTSEGLKVVNEELANARVNECCCYEAELHRINGELLLRETAADEQQAEACFQNALKIARGQSAKSLELRAAMSLSRLWQSQGKKAEAQNLLAEVYGWFTEGFDTADLKQAKLLLEELA